MPFFLPLCLWGQMSREAQQRQETDKQFDIAPPPQAQCREKGKKIEIMLFKKKKEKKSSLVYICIYQF